MPHTLYVEAATYKYEVWNSLNNNGTLTGFKQYEWNRIMFKVIVSSGTTSVCVFVNNNFDVPEFPSSFPCKPVTDNMILQRIAFCQYSASLNKKNCQAIGKDIEFGSAFYKNIRVWEVSSAPETVALAYNNNVNVQFKDVIKSLILYYPLTINYLAYTTGLNEFKNLIGILKGTEFDNFKYSDTYGPTAFGAPYKIYHSDNLSFSNWSKNFDWNIANPGKYITQINNKIVTSGTCNVACTKCYSQASTACYECATGYVLRSQKCIPITNYYLKTPVTSGATVNIKITDAVAGYDVTAEEAVTITVWMKFFGVILLAAPTQPSIFSINSNSFFAYDISSKNLLFLQNNTPAFEDTVFSSNIGKWTLITLSNYKAGTISTYFPHMINISSGQRDLPMKSTYSIPAAGISITQLNFGNECVALFANLRFYNKYIQGAFGWIMT